MPNRKYHIYSHADADGGIAAAIFSRFIHQKYGKYDWDVEIHSVQHGNKHGEWHLQAIAWPCAILDFTLHPSLLNDRFFIQGKQTAGIAKDEKHIPSCYWIDHHPTGSNFPFLNSENLDTMLPSVISKWDTHAISTPGLLRTHREELGIPHRLLKEYEEFIDLAEIIDGALFANGQAAHDFSTPAVKLQTLFCPSHPLVDKQALYKKLVQQIWKNPSVEDLFDTDPIYAALIAHEQNEFYKHLHAYQKVSKLKGKVAYTNFIQSKHYSSMGRFIPYLIYPESQYALHVMPKGKEEASLSCGINPWNPPKNQTKHLGNYFAQYFSGGGHAFVAGGKISLSKLEMLEQLIDHLNS